MKKYKIQENLPSEPTKSELEILQVLWEFGPSTVRFVNDKLNEQKREVHQNEENVGGFSTLLCFGGLLGGAARVSQVDRVSSAGNSYIGVVVR